MRDFNSMMGEISSGGVELRSAETVDRSGRLLEAGAVETDVSETSNIDLVKELIPHFPDTVAFLNKVETVDKSGPVIDPNVKITISDPSDTRSPHLKAIQAAAAKRSYLLMKNLKDDL